MSRYKQVCKQCSTDFKSKGPNSKFCCRECKLKWNSENRHKHTNCIVCNTKFRIINTINNKNKFCSRRCYGDRMKSHPEEFNLIDRCNVMRESLSEDSWKKGLETRKRNGNVIDWNISEWKQYWRRCNDLTRKMRKQLLETWDGYDYIDGEYIKDNLELPYTHSDYPTLDHIIPRSEGFKQGLSPYEITTPDNLKWTKRVNNSKKGSKV